MTAIFPSSFPMNSPNTIPTHHVDAMKLVEDSLPNFLHRM
jgi:hypothetical protein